MVKNITAADFDATVASGDVLVDFWATWCGPCMMMGERIETDLVPRLPNLTVAKVNVDECPELAARFGIMSIPALMCYRGGVKVRDFVGVTPIDELEAVFR